MAQEPIAPTLMDAYRTVLLTSSAPSFIDTEVAIVPVAMITSATQALNVAVTGANNALVKGSAIQTLIATGNGKAGTAVTAGTGLALRTVTAGKTFYMTALSLGSDGTSNGTEIRDNGLTGTLKMGFQAFNTGSRNQNWSFPTPISFTTNVFLDLATSQTVWYAVSGWEE